MDNQAVNEAIEILINNFLRHQTLSQSVSGESECSSNVFDVLEEFWLMKSSGDINLSSLGMSAASKCPNTASFASKSSNPSIVYEFLEKPGPPYICFVTLPGGACFANFQVGCFFN
jgi:hypothetical protein